MQIWRCTAYDWLSLDNDLVEPDMSIVFLAVLSGYFGGNRAELLDRVLSCLRSRR